VTLLRAADAGPAQWVVDSLKTFAQNVASIVPSGFESYARVFHPAQRSHPDSPRRVRWVMWTEIATANGRVVHPEMQFEGIVPSGTFDGYNQVGSQPGLWDHVPNEGDFEDVAPLLVILRTFTTTPERCWYAIWEGWGRATPLVKVGAPPPIAEPDVLGDQEPASFETPHRRYYLFEGPLDAQLDPACDVFDHQSPSLWWPDDRKWCVATEIDLMSTYVGGSAGCIDAILSSPHLEALPATLTDEIGRYGDRINPTPPRPSIPATKRRLRQRRRP
jgi:hypothetical protein